MKNRFLAILLTLCLVLNMAPTAVFAQEFTPSGEGNVCSHHIHDERCGYTAPTAQAPCDKLCTDSDGDGIIDHTAECAYREAVVESPCTFDVANCEICHPKDSGSPLPDTAPDTLSATAPNTAPDTLSATAPDTLPDTLSATAPDTLPTTANPTTASPTATKDAVPQRAVSFALNNEPHYADTSLWKVYADSAAAAPLTDVTASCAANTLTLTHSDNIPAATYYVTVTQQDKAESERLALTVNDPTPPPEEQPPIVEQFSLPLGQTYYFDLSSLGGNLGTVNANLPDKTLHYLPFTYVGTVNAYSLGHDNQGGNSGSSTDAAPSTRSLFLSEYNVITDVSWNRLKEPAPSGGNLIFSENYDETYFLRVLSGGNNSSAETGIAPLNNEWGQLYLKDSSYIKNCDTVPSWAQDTTKQSSDHRAALGGEGSPLSWRSAACDSKGGWRPALEVDSSAKLGSDDLKAVTLNLGVAHLNGRSEIAIVCAGGSFTAPSATGLTMPTGMKLLNWKDSQENVYLPGAVVPNSVRSLTAQLTLADDDAKIVGDFILSTKVKEGYSYDDTLKVLTISKGGSYTIRMNFGVTKTSQRISIAADSAVYLLLNGVNITAMEGNSALTISGELETYLMVADGSVNSLTGGSLTAKGGDGVHYGAGALSIGVLPAVEGFDLLTPKSSGGTLSITGGNGFSSTAFGGNGGCGISGTGSLTLGGTIKIRGGDGGGGSDSSAKNVNGGKGGKGGDGIVSPSSTLALGDITTSGGKGGKGGKGGIGYNSPFSVYPPSVGGDGGDGGIGLNVGSSLTTQAKGKITATGGDGGYGGMGGKGGNPPPTGVITSASDGSSGGTGGCGGNGVLSPDLVTALKSVAVATGGMGGKGGKGGKSGGGVGGANGLAGAAHNGNLGGAGGTGGAGGAKGAEAAAGTDDELNVNTAVINNISAVAAPPPAILAGGTLNNHGGVQLTNPPLLSNDTLKFAVTGHDVAQAAAHYYHHTFLYGTTLFLSSTGGKYGLSLQSKLSPLFSVAGSAQYLNGADYNIASLMQAIAAYSVNAWAHYSQYSENEDTNILAALHPASVAGGYQLAIRRLSPYGFGQNNSEYALALATATTVTADVQQAMSVANVASLTVASQYSMAQINQNLFSTLNGISGKAFTLTMTPMGIGHLTGSPIADVTIGASANEQLNHDLGAGTTGMSAWRNTQAGKMIDDRPMCDFSITDENGKKIENFGGESIFFGIPYTLKQGEDASRLFAVYLDENGKAVSIANSFYSIADNMIYGRADHSGIYSIGYNANVSKFTDITEHWAQGDINFVLTRGLMTGTAKTLFSPDGEITKEDFVKALSVIAGKDVSNIIKGDKKQTLKRQEMAELMLQFIKATGHEISDIREEMKFTDTSDQAVKAMQMAGIIMGKDTTFFDPDSPVTRAQAAAVFRRYVGLLLSGNSPSQGFDMTDSGELVLYSDGKLVKGTKTFGNVKLDFDKQGICIKIETVPDNKKYVTHKLAYGDTLWDLSKKYNCTVEEITQLNGINNPRSVPIGTELKIPQK